MEDYYKNTDCTENYYTSTDNNTDYYTSTDGVSVPEFFTVEILRVKVIIYYICFLIPIVLFIWWNKYFVMFENDGYAGYAFVLRLMLLLFLAFLIIGFWENAGKKIQTFGNTISITRWFFVHEDISIRDVTECEVITGLTSHGRYHTTHYNKIVIHYGDRKKISVTDITYSNWNMLARYMDYKGKASFIDGRNFFDRFFDSRLGN